MQIFNLDRLIVFGPGSEWFWAMAQFIVVVVSLGGIYVQLRAQGAANALQKMQFFVERWDSDAMAHDRLATAIQLKYGPPTTRMQPSMVAIADFFETLAELEESGHVSRRDVQMWARSMEMWWALLEPAVNGELQVQKFALHSGWRRLTGVMHEMDRAVGESYVLDATTLPSILDDIIRINTGFLERARAMSAGEIPRPPAAT